LDNCLVKTNLSHYFQSLGVSVTTEMLQELETQRARLERMLQQNEVMRHQLEVNAYVAKVNLTLFLLHFVK
jgi:hypothetical protein